jgi:hypothetical protein
MKTCLRYITLALVCTLLTSDDVLYTKMAAVTPSSPQPEPPVTVYVVSGPVRRPSPVVLPPPTLALPPTTPDTLSDNHMNISTGQLSVFVTTDNYTGNTSVAHTAHTGTPTDVVRITSVHFADTLDTLIIEFNMNVLGARTCDQIFAPVTLAKLGVVARCRFWCVCARALR